MKERCFHFPECNGLSPFVKLNHNRLKKTDENVDIAGLPVQRQEETANNNKNSNNSNARCKAYNKGRSEQQRRLEETEKGWVGKKGVVCC